MGLGAEKVLVQKSGYFSRSAPANDEDIRLIKSCTTHAVTLAVRRIPGVVGHDEERGGVLRGIEFERIKGGKPFDTTISWFQTLLQQIGQNAVYEGDVRKVVPTTDAVDQVRMRINAQVKKRTSMLLT